MGFAVRFWGVRGSIACPSPNHIKYGGNTSCVELQLGEHRLILDAGTGIRPLGQQLLRDRVAEAVLLLTHTHWDHINGFPFFEPAYNPQCAFRVMAGHLDGGRLRDVLSTQMDNPVFPVPLDAMKARLVMEDFRAGSRFNPYPDVVVRTGTLNHPNGATGYRIEYFGKVACYVTDTEHVPGTLDASILELIEGADLVIYDSTYTEDEFPSKQGWGHSTWNEGVRLCRAARARKLVLFHHEPDHDDRLMDGIAAAAARAWPEAAAAREGMVITL